ncbi:DUF4920 domain-containing protein [Flavobacterium sp. J372]|uniref:DUF4920 domain-containing protein n=1 Tax=Flavobacterium sp. J372 TaxID=2898436 RepID=UPI0021508441|nr:DUF4920 domain-containing protein [Flavobacterium sp. J372]MCR5861842.1 DUF4920 domain-containing protein [Flavobacterium sp. J372]
MKKIAIAAAALITLAACQNKESKETTVTTEETVIEGKADTTIVDTDTVVSTETGIEEGAVPAVEADAKKADEKPSDKKVTAVKPAAEVKVEYASFGDKIAAVNALSKDEMLKKYRTMKPGDTIAVKFKSKVKDVCQKKGCWMAMELPGGKESFVKFKDYAFFVPLNAAESEAIVSGKAFVSETSVAALRHYAKDGGQSDAEIAKITEPKVEYKFMADGVLISK